MERLIRIAFFLSGLAMVACHPSANVREQGADSDNEGEHVRLTNLPHVYINTLDGREVASKTEYTYATMWYVDEEDQVTRYDSIEIRIRGNSTSGISPKPKFWKFWKWKLRKKEIKRPYKLKFKEKEKLLGKGYAKARKWTLLANAYDKTLMRNAVTSEMGKFLGMRFNPAAKFVDLTMNDVFMGNYQISDQVEVRQHRVNVAKQDYPLSIESDITGGYLLEVDEFKKGNCFITSCCQVPIRIRYPDDGKISDDQNQYICQYVEEFEAALFSEDFADSKKGYRKWVDSTSLVNWFIATEVSANIDGYFSVYFYKDSQDSLLYWGPLWDYDIAYGNDCRMDETSEKLMVDVAFGRAKKWMNRMLQDPWFCDLVSRRYEEAVKYGLEDFLMQKIDSISELLQASQELNYHRWGIEKKMYRENVLHPTYGQYVQDLKEFISAHMAFLHTAFANLQPVESSMPISNSEDVQRE